MNEKLTAQAVKAATPKEKQYKLSDGNGMFLLVHPNGSKYWRLKYRIAGKEKTLALGVYPGVGLSEARKLCVKARELISQGIDPIAQRREAQSAAEEKERRDAL
ncbi:MAG: Arm DNA-binding domain-containing protein, partial [Desulfovibrio sp.]|nr:Arm DNA-binding domain-containing protein [Desulfovibrio sp.]